MTNQENNDPLIPLAHYSSPRSYRLLMEPIATPNIPIEYPHGIQIPEAVAAAVSDEEVTGFLFVLFDPDPF